MNNNFECRNGIYLEPRLQEYIKKKIYYKKNKINPVVPLEQEFTISREDIRRLKAFRSGDKDIYNYKKQDMFMDEYEETPFEFDSDKLYKSDIRYQRFAKKLKKDKEAIKQRYNCDNFDKDYENSFNPITDFWNDNENTRLLDIQDNNRHVNILDSRDFNIGTNTRRQNTEFNSEYKCNNPKRSKLTYRNSELPQYTPKIDFRNKIYPMQNNRPQQLPIDHNPRLEEIIGQLDSYGNKINSTYQYMSEMDTDFKVTIPNVSSNGKRLVNSSSYRSVPFVRTEGIRDIDAESEMKNSLITRGGKSYGYDNPVEHYYDYISNDIQNPNHVVFDPGRSTRLDNHRIARPYKREIIN